MVIVFVVGSQSTEQSRFSVTNLKGSIVRELIISGTTLEFDESIGVSTPLILAIDLPIQSSTVILPKVTVTFLSVASQETVPPRDSITARIWRRVLLFLITGGESKVLEMLFTVKPLLPIWRMITVACTGFL